MPKLNVDRLKREMGLVTWDEFYFNILNQVSSRSNSDERRQGAILVKNNSIIATGCFDAYEKKNSQEQKEGEKERVVGSGAIENALATCANNGISTNGAALFTYTFPNDIVCKLLIKAGISEIKYIKPNDSAVLGKELCNKMNIKLTQFQRS